MIWNRVPLKELLNPVNRPENVEPQKSYSILGAHWYAHGLYTKEVKDGSEIRAKKVYRVEEGDFVYNRLFAWKGSFALASSENDGCYVSNEFPCFRVREDSLNGQYLWHYFSRETAWNEALGLSSGSTPTSRNRLKVEKLLAMEIPLPPLDEQRRIVAHIEQLAARIEEARGLRQHAIEEAEVLLSSSKAEVLSTHGKTTVRDFARVSSGYAFKSDWYSQNGIKLLRNANVSHGSIDWTDTVYLPKDAINEYQRFALSEGDILVSLDRPIISTGVKVAKLTEDDVPSLLVQRVGKFNFKDKSILPDFMLHWLQSPHFINTIDPGRSNGVPHISQKDIEKIPFSPPSIEVQHQIVSHLDALQTHVEKLKHLQAKTQAELDALLPSILDKAFKGEL